MAPTSWYRAVQRLPSVILRAATCCESLCNKMFRFISQRKTWLLYNMATVEYDLCIFILPPYHNRHRIFLVLLDRRPPTSFGMGRGWLLLERNFSQLTCIITLFLQLWQENEVFTSRNGKESTRILSKISKRTHAIRIFQHGAAMGRSSLNRITGARTLAREYVLILYQKNQGLMCFLFVSICCSILFF